MTTFKAPLSVLDLPPVEPVYTFVDHAGEATHIAAGLLGYALREANWPTGRAEIGGTLADALKAGTLGVEEPHALSLPVEALETPIIVCEWGAGDHVIADGAHRLWRRWKRGDTDLICYMVPEHVWRKFTIYDMPGDTGVVEARWARALVTVRWDKDNVLRRINRSRIVTEPLKYMGIEVVYDPSIPPDTVVIACSARYNRLTADQYKCVSCGVVWDVDEPRPPCKGSAVIKGVSE